MIHSKTVLKTKRHITIYTHVSSVLLLIMFHGTVVISYEEFFLWSASVGYLSAMCLP